MSREIPQVVRAAAGLAATVLDEARKLPGELPGLPVRVIGLAMQATMRLQQQYSGLVARGDELFTGLRGENEPGMATFDEDLPPAPPVEGSAASARTSAFDRAAAVVPDRPGADEDTTPEEQVPPLVDDEILGLPDDEPGPEEVVEALEDIADEVREAGIPAASGAPQPGLSTEDELETALLEADGAPDEALVDGGSADAGTVDADLVAEAPTTLPEPLDTRSVVAGDAAPTDTAPTDTDTTATDTAPTDTAPTDTDTTATDTAPTDTAPTDPGGSPVGEAGGAPDVTGEVDVLTPDGGVATVEGTVTDEGVAAPETAAPETAAPETAAAEPATAEPATAEPATPPTTGADTAEATDAATDGAPVDGYESMTIAQLRGRLRGYQLSTVADLLAYEEANEAREPYLRMLRNRLEKLERQAVESSPLAPRGM
ncbi:hypothetical protein ACI8AC_24530 [Geodermatophilus sp. SYSU D00758]